MTTIVRAGLLILSGKTAPIRDGSIVIDDNGRIAHVGDDRGLDSIDARVLEYPGCSVLPGLVNAHDHLRDPRPDPSPGARDGSVAAQAVLAVAAARRHLLNGVTSVRVLGTIERLDLAVRSAVEDRTIPGPRLVCAGRALTSVAGSPYANAITDVDTAVAATEDELSAGADVIKVFASRGVSAVDDGGAPSDQLVPEDHMRAIVRRADSAGVPVAAHAHGSRAIDAALRAGVRSIEHGVGLSQEQARVMAGDGVAYVPTMSTYRRIAARGLGWGLPATWVETAETLAADHVMSVRNAAEAGVTIAVGTDSFGDFHDELAALQEVGLDPLAIIGAATSAGAAALGLDTRVGRLMPGMIGDLIVVEGDPTSSIASIREVRAVITQGVVHPTHTDAAPEGSRT